MELVERNINGNPTVNQIHTRYIHVSYSESKCSNTELTVSSLSVEAFFPYITVGSNEILSKDNKAVLSG